MLNTTATGDYLSARDSDGHGTHTSSTAGGNFADTASCLGFATGIAKGGAPMARVAMYKVCWPSSLGTGGCYDADILMAFDQGISDGVNVFSVSLGSDPPLPSFFEDGLAIGSFHASQANISVVCSAGNSGPSQGTVANVAPWMTTVAAASVDRDFQSYAELGNGISIHVSVLFCFASFSGQPSPIGAFDCQKVCHMVSEQCNHDSNVRRIEYEEYLKTKFELCLGKRDSWETYFLGQRQEFCNLGKMLISLSCE